MEAEPGQVFDYYKRAYELADALRRRQDPPPTDPPPSSTIPPSSSSIISVSSQSEISTSSLSSVISTSSVASVSSTSVSSAAPTSLTSITSDVSSTISSEMLTTDSAGNQVTTTVVIVPTATVTGSPANKTNTGAIVGGVVGGVGLLVLIGIAIFLIRRKMKRDEFEANIFDPDRNVQRPHSSEAGPKFDLGGGGTAAGVAGAGVGVAAHDAASNVTPYPHSSSGGGGPASTYYGSSVGGQPEMQQAPSNGYYSDYNQYGPHNQYPQHNMTGYNQHHYQSPSVGVGEHFPNPYAPGYQSAAYPAAAGAGMGLAAGAGLMRGATTGSTATNSTSPYPTTVASPVFSNPYDGRSSPSASPPPSVAALAPNHNQAPLSARAAKEREAFSRSRPNFTVTNAAETHPAGGMPNEAAYGGVVPGGGGAARNPSPVPSRTSNNSAQPISPVVVHQDGGRVPDDDDDSPTGAEIPPTYDSIPQDRR